MLKAEKTGVPGRTGSGVVDIGGGGGGGGGKVMRSCGANADSADDIEDKADNGDWNCPSPVAVDADDVSGTRRCCSWLSDDSIFTGPLTDGFTTPPTKFSLAGVRIDSSEADSDLAVCSTYGILFGVTECLSEGIVDWIVADTVWAGGAS